MKMQLTIFPDPLTNPKGNGAVQYLETARCQYLTRTKTALNMKHKILSIVVCSVLMTLLSGCKSEGLMKGGYTEASLSLTGKNYRLIQGGATGKDYGFWILFFPIVSPNHADAKAKMYKTVKEPLTGKAIALINQTEDHSYFTLILFSITRITMSADVIEFTGNENPVPIK